jgi:hypothetical protein
MAKKCNHCNSVFGDDVLYCPECGSKTVTLNQQPQSHHSSQSTGFNFMEWSLLAVAILGLYMVWEVNWEWGAVLGIGVLITPYVDKRGIDFKAPMACKVIAIIDLVLAALCLFA